MTIAAMNQFNRSSYVRTRITFVPTQPDYHHYHRNVWPVSVMNSLRCARSIDFSETAETLADEELMKQFHLGVKQLDAGEGIAWDELQAELGL